MNIDELKQVVENSYGLKVIELEKVKNVYRIRTLQENYCLKIIKYKFLRFYFILSAIKHLQDNDFDRVPEIIKKLDGTDYINLGDINAYLTNWINARECNYDNPLDVCLAAKKLGELHNKSEGFIITDKMEPRDYWYKWFINFSTRRDEILDFEKRISVKEKKSEFDILYLSVMEEELKRVDNSIKNLIRSDYIEKINEDILKGGFCHHDYAHHNVLLEEDGRVNIIDFDYCILDTNLHDVASLLLRRMKNGKWDLKNAEEILNSYSKARNIERRDISIMAAFMEFPQDYWQVGIQYYWEKQPWGEDFFIKKLKKTVEDREEKQEFIEDFRNLK